MENPKCYSKYSTGIILNTFNVLMAKHLLNMKKKGNYKKAN